MRLSVVAVALCLSIIGVSTAGPAEASIKKHTEIPAQGLGPALQTLAEQHDLQIVYKSEVVGDLRTQGIAGELTLAEALTQLLNGTGLTYQFLEDQAITILPLSTKTTASSSAAPIQESTAPQTGNLLAAGEGSDSVPREKQGEEETKKGFWQRFRLAQNDQSSRTSAAEEDKESSRQDLRSPQETGKAIPEILVTSTRLIRQNVPTPLMVVDADMLREGARANVVAALNDLPQFKASFAPQINAASIYSGVWSINLRGLGTPAAPSARTLVLFDGRRLIGSYNFLDSAVIPSILVNRVDVVTGSASAAWGSNAVAGVVNFVLNDQLEGFRTGIATGMSTQDDGLEASFEVAAGTSFANDKGHFLVGGEYVENDGIGPKTERSNVGRWAVTSNPNFTATNGQQPLMILPDVGFARASPGGLILTGVNAGQAFNADGSLRPFDLGRVSGINSIGGEGPSLDDYIFLTPPSKRYNTMARLTYDLTDDIELTADVLHARASSDYPWIPDFNLGGITISSDNAFLPAAIRDQMAAAGETSFTMGRMNADYAFIRMDYERVTTQASVALVGHITEQMRWDAYYSHGEFDEDIDLPNSRIGANFASAVDSVISPTTGQPICRIALTLPGTNCVPINLFGEGAPSQAARDYALGTGMQRLKQTLDTGGLSLRGEPFDLWAGPLSFALGAEARREYVNQAVGPIDRAKGFTFFNNPTFTGENTTREAFGEVMVPIVRDVPLLRKLEFNGAARITDDRTGSIWSWKLGLIDQVVNGLQLRLTTSRDIRSPNLSELFSTPLLSFVNISDPQLNTAYQVRTFSGGNPELEPEASRTWTAGVTIAPSGIPDLEVSADYFDIDIGNAVGSITAQQIVNLCSQGNTALCSQITRNPDGTIATISAVTLNLVKFQTRGLDAMVEYKFPVSLPGALRLRTNATWVTKYQTDNGLAVVDYLGTQGTITGGTLGTPRLLANAALYYDTGHLQADLRARFISAGYFNKTQAIQNNRIPAYAYFDLGARYALATGNASETEIFANVNNLLDKEPPIASTASPYYDVIGRYFTVGAKIRF